MIRNRQAKAQVGEVFICDLLEKAKWTILARNFRTTGSELDIVAKKGETIAVVEVKLRSPGGLPHIDGSDLIPHRKVKALTRGFYSFISKQEHLGYSTARIDLALVGLSESNAPSLLNYWSHATEFVSLDD